MSGLHILSQIVGWIYFLAWGVSFYGQVYENWKQKNVGGMSFEFVGLNLTGFLFLSVYSTVGYFDPQYLNGTFEVQDLCFAYNAVFATLVTISQAIIYPRDKGQKVEPWCVCLLIALWSFTIIYGIVEAADDNFRPSVTANVFAIMGYEKLLISLVKYCPQVYRNYVRKSTKGWSIFNILCDITGGSLSFLQIVLDNLDHSENNPFNGGLNVVKFGLSVISIFFDIIFVWQHYILYADKDPKLISVEHEDEVSIHKVHPRGD